MSGPEAHHTASPDESGHLLRNMVLFGRLLRVGRLDVTTLQIRDWLAATETIDLGRREDFRDATRSVLVSRREDLPWFEAAFDLFWQPRDPQELEELELGLMIQRQTKKTERQGTQQVAAEATEAPDRERPEVRASTYSDRENLKNKDFAELSGPEIEQIKRLMYEMRWRLETRKTRRSKPSHRGRSIDFRRSLRTSLARDGELVELRRLNAKRVRRPLVLLCDVSGSMEPYSRLLLHFIYAMSHQRSVDPAISRVEAFAFGTRLTRITTELRSRDVDRALQAATKRIADWGGGTKTGESLKEFNYTWSRRVLGRGAVVLIISDGWDRGDIDLLGHEMDRLRRSSHRLIWLNPLLGAPTYEPLTRGIQAALPHVSDFLPVHNLTSLEQLGDVLAGI